jgi:hypothetical protein
LFNLAQNRLPLTPKTRKMRKTFSLAILFLLSLTLFAQKAKDIPAFGKVDKADLEISSLQAKTLSPYALILILKGRSIVSTNILTSRNFISNSSHC